jgi:hypothetical protein
MPRIKTTLNEGFEANIDYEVSCDDVSEVRIYCPVSGIELTNLISYSSTAWDQAWNAAERHLLSQPKTKEARNDIRSMTYDTPYAVVVA